ncbi:MAG: hypothetical protein ACYDCH_00290 [Gaiellaceae bacterium]
MRRSFGPRTVVEAAFLVAVPAVAVLAGSGKWTIIAASAVAYLLVLFVEATLWREAAEPAAPPVESLASREQPEPTNIAAEPRPESLAAGAAPELVAAEPEPIAAPVVERPPLTALPTLPPPPPPVVPDPAPVINVVPLGYGREPREWNLWELERLAREHAGSDTVRDEERTFLLMYLRDFAGPDGLLPLDFDALVRDSFGELVNG